MINIAQFEKESEFIDSIVTGRDLGIKLYYVYRIKVCVDFYGPSPVRFETISVVATDFDKCLEFIHNLYKRRDNLYSYEILDKTECVVL